MTDHHSGEGAAALAEDVARILDGDNSTVAPTMRFSAAIKAAGVDHTLILFQDGGTLHVDQVNDSKLRQLLAGTDLPIGQPSPWDRSGFVYPLTDNQLAAYATALEERFRQESPND
ncbi:hypothetical protein ABZT26_35215 [Streptomyces sp. NPDC005395]|uniref:hypothetical protein n=1 Tax=Streptomyces sp. NPDC005395 TaxID=3157042 RepID=UPI0033A9D560